ncbi:MAG: hypothetical protein COB69_02475 [Phycisphaera sp.]|nr:MAG: hypothetical protein COB69_02475 [Phycisphaera sp.]
MASPHDLKPACDASGPAEAHIIASMLREAGIEAFVFDTAAQTLQWHAPQIISPYLVHVQRADLERAHQIIRSNREESVDLDWDEVDVGEPIDETAKAASKSKKPTQPIGFLWPLRWKNLHRWLFLGILVYIATVLILNTIAYISWYT